MLRARVLACRSLRRLTRLKWSVRKMRLWRNTDGPSDLTGEQISTVGSVCQWKVVGAEDAALTRNGAVRFWVGAANRTAVISQLGSGPSLLDAIAELQTVRMVYRVRSCSHETLAARLS